MGFPGQSSYTNGEGIYSHCIWRVKHIDSVFHFQKPSVLISHSIRITILAHCYFCFRLLLPPNMTSDISHLNLSSVYTSFLRRQKGIQGPGCAFMSLLFRRTVQFHHRAWSSQRLIGAAFLDSHGLDSHKLNGRIVKSICKGMKDLIGIM